MISIVTVHFFEEKRREEKRASQPGHPRQINYSERTMTHICKYAFKKSRYVYLTVIIAVSTVAAWVVQVVERRRL